MIQNPCSRSAEYAIPKWPFKLLSLSLKMALFSFIDLFNVFTNRYANPPRIAHDLHHRLSQEAHLIEPYYLSTRITYVITSH